MSFEQVNNNKVFVAGAVNSQPILSHEVMGEKFFEFDLKIKRLSGSYDIVPITISEKILTGEIEIGNNIAGNGQFRSYNKLENDKSKLLLTVFLRELVQYDEKENPNVIELNGFICKDPVYRTTPFNREICDVLVAVNRSYNKSDYLPCIAWGRNAKYVKDFSVGDNIKIVGRIQSRQYQKKELSGEIVQKTAYEISLNRVNKINDMEEQFVSQKSMSLNI